MTAPDPEEAIIRFERVHHAYGRHAALVDLSFDIRKNEWVFVSGPSGAGKTTLLKLIYGGAGPAAGRITVDGAVLPGLAPRRLPELRRRLGVIFQDYKLIAGRTVYENVALVLEAAGRPRAVTLQKAKTVLRLVGMEGRMDALPPTLSGGEQQRVAVARALAGDPKIILADEPTGSLDEDSARVIMDLLRGAHIRGATVVIATHDRAFMRRMGGRVLVLERGRLAASGMIEKRYDRAAH
jgi:cell division transport system ATP-binding protein